MRCPHCNQPIRNERWETYESAKRAWVRDHPDASEEEYHAAMREIAREVGV